MLARFLRKLSPSSQSGRLNRPQTNRLRVELLEDRLTPNNRFVVPLPVQADNVTTFHTLAAALSTPGLATGNSVQIEPFSTPGAISNANIDAIDTTNVTIRGAANFAPSELPAIRTSDAISVDSQEAGLTFQNVNLQIDQTFTFNVNGAIRNSHVVVGATGGNGIQFVGTSTSALQGNTLVNTGVNPLGAFIRVTPAAGSSNLIDGNTVINSTGSYSILYGGASNTIGDVISNNTFLGFEGVDSNPLVTVSNFGGLTIRKNTFRDATASYAGLYLLGADNVQVLDNVFDMTSGASPIDAALRIESSSGNDASATVRLNTFSTGTFGRGIDVSAVSSGVVNVKIEANNFLATPLGVRVTAVATTTVGTIDLGGGALGSLGANNFRVFSTAASPTAGAIVVDGGANNLSALTINAQNNLFGVADPETVIRDTADDGTEANVVATGNLTGNAAFVQALYTRFLKRVADVANPNGAGAWVNFLNSGGTQQAVANAIIRSPEALGYVVDDLYRTILGRDADPVGRDYHVNLMLNGWTIETVQIGLLGGAEYKVRFPGDAAFITSLYNSILGRSPQGGVAAWLDLLPTYGRSGVTAGFVLSTEYRTTQVKNLFFDLLKRTPANAPTAQQVADTVNTGLDLLSLRVAFASGAEFFAVG